MLFAVKYWISSGATNKGLKIISQEYRDHKLYLTVDGLSGEQYQLNLLNRSGTDLIQSAEGAELREHAIVVPFEKQPQPKYLRKEIVLTLKKSL